MTTDQEWQPGDPLYPRHGSGQAGAQYRLYLFNFRDDPDSEDCCCADAASWPKPRNRPLPEGDEIGDFIRHWRWWQAQTTSAPQETA